MCICHSDRVTSAVGEQRALLERLHDREREVLRLTNALRTLDSERDQLQLALAERTNAASELAR